jgi:glycosyltransferase involved in cell wall biosynthesis
MKIGMMVDAYKPYISGVTNYIAINKQALEKLGHEVYVFTFGFEDYQDDEPNVIRSTGLPVFDTGFYISLRYNSHAVRLVRTMDVVHVHHPFISGQLALRYCRSRGIPIIFTNHTRYDLYAQVYAPMVPDAISETAIQAYLPAFCRSVDLVVSPSPGMKEVLQRFGVDAPIDVVPNGVDIRPFQHPTNPLTRAELGYDPGDIILVFVGRLGLEKNVQFLLRAFAATLQACSAARLMLIGDGPERENLKSLARQMGVEDQVQFVGKLPYEEIPRYLACANAFVTASTTEVHPLTVIEGMASGLPVLGIQSPGIGDTVEDGVTGMLVNSEDLPGFTAKMVRLVVDREERQKLGGMAGREAEKYAIELTCRMMLERYERVVQQAEGKPTNLGGRISRRLKGQGPS